VQIDAGKHIRKDIGLIWAWTNRRNRGEENTIKTTIKEVVRGLVKQESGYVGISQESKMPKKSKTSEGKSE